jgi:organic hydroperoxide reductase OsmC/OhrA
MAGRARLYEANVVGTGNRGQGTSAYTAYGRDHVARAAGKPDLPMSADQAFLGNPARHNPEDLLVVAISSCHMLWYLHLCATARIIVRAYEDRPSGRLIDSQESGGHFESVLLRLSPAAFKRRCASTRTRLSVDLNPSALLRSFRAALP